MAVTRPGELPRRETARLLAQLRELDVPVAGLIVNAVTPPGCARCRRAAAREQKDVGRLAAALRRGSPSAALVVAPLVAPPPRGDAGAAGVGQPVDNGGRCASPPHAGPWQGAAPPRAGRRRARSRRRTSTAWSRRTHPRGSKGAPAGLQGTGPLRLAGAGDGRWLVVADAPLAAYSADAVNARLSDLDWVGERAMEHERVVEHVAARGTVVPMKLFTLFSSDARALADVKRPPRTCPRLLARLGRPRGVGRARLDGPRPPARGGGGEGASARRGSPRGRGSWSSGSRSGGR